ncbi:TetR family transcriptional regulator [Actinoplanes sp. SE50]|uniref:TetR/AcrR family transcriptional regulator n=1 Tax=unclassified Actinoplanes TaxID=2626549 RepID=UPI00023EC0F8|nr:MULTISPECIES: TetR/AcrR family transcriptional regulator [unclassified Actinoplanes]AEV85175.1 HTH-type transcriptional regulator betI [Actinoplanes sp. SE50/110]ATO83570.1 TetR family transcriptional regulator [Actinoplanes sp. SE50]SLM00977.1 TetR family transcriptional regulator [Actinoplanes sp. SE50/110]
MPRPATPGSRDAILHAASRLFYSHGVRAVGMAQVIDAAGCGKNLLYRHFPSKTDLAAAYLKLVRADRDRSADIALNGAADPGSRLVALVGEVAALVRGPHYRGCAFRNYLTEFPGDDDEPARIARAYLRDTRARIDDLVAARGLAPVTADRIWLIVGGLYAGPADQAEVAVDWVRELVAQVGYPTGSTGSPRHGINNG